MAERFRLKVGVTKIDPCRGCPISEMHFKGNTDRSTSTCRIAELERKLGKIPTYKEVEETYHISGTVYWFDIPTECPNEYLNPDTLLVSKRK